MPPAVTFARSRSDRKALPAFFQEFSLELPEKFKEQQHRANPLQAGPMLLFGGLAGTMSKKKRRFCLCIKDRNASLVVWGNRNLSKRNYGGDGSIPEE